MAKTKTWVPLESNPDVLNTFASKLGLDTDTYLFTDIFGLDEELLAMVPQPVIAVVLCFPITDQSEAAACAEDEEQAAQGVAVDPNVFYMKQTIGNACGTIALLHSIGNNTDKMTPGEGSFLAQFFGAVKGMTPEQAGKFLEDPPEGGPDIEEAHQAAAAAGDTAPPPEDEDVNLHFVAFVHKNGKLWQLDGRRARPICHGPTSEALLLQDTAVVVRQFMERSNSITFNLLALTAAC